MFEMILSPIIQAVKVWMSDKTYQAAKTGAAEGLRRFVAEVGDFAEGMEALPMSKPAAIPLTMPSAAQETEAPAVPANREDKIATAQQMSQEGQSQRDIAAALGVAQSTVNGWLNR